MSIQEQLVSILVSKQFIKRLQSKIGKDSGISAEQVVEAYLWYGLFHHEDALRIDSSFRHAKKTKIEELFKKASIVKK